MEVERVTLQMLFDGCLENKEQNSFVVLEWKMLFFSGTELRKPMGSAYVAITLDNSDHSLPIQFEEVTVARRVYRSGESEYLINGSACRRKDIVELFFDTGIERGIFDHRTGTDRTDLKWKRKREENYLMKQQEQAEKMSDIRGEVRDINFGNQIRSYVMQPYTMVKDHRTNAEVSNVGGVMDGNIDPFINAYLSANTEQASEQ